MQKNKGRWISPPTLLLIIKCNKFFILSIIYINMWNISLTFKRARLLFIKVPNSIESIKFNQFHFMFLILPIISSFNIAFTFISPIAKINLTIHYLAIPIYNPPISFFIGIATSNNILILFFSLV